jgi:hypothetical protein
VSRMMSDDGDRRELAPDRVVPVDAPPPAAPPEQRAPEAAPDLPRGPDPMLVDSVHLGRDDPPTRVLRLERDE